MITALIILGIILIPFYEIIFRLFPNVAVVAQDTRSHKEIMAVIIALAIGLSAQYSARIKPINNKWIFLFILFPIIAFSQIPRIPLVINSIDCSGFWVWKPMYEMICFFLMFLAICSKDFNEKETNLILKIIVWVVFIQSCYVVLQAIGLDQYFIVKQQQIAALVTSPNRVGTLGQPTLVASFIAMLIPICFHMKRYFFAIVGIIAVYLTGSMVAMIALAVGLILYFSIKHKKAILLFPISITLICIKSIHLCLTNYKLYTHYLEYANNGRFSAWKTTIGDMMNTPIQGYEGTDFSFLGHGLGSFAYLSTVADKTAFASVHNDYLELIYCIGLVGFLIFAIAVLTVVKDLFRDFKNTNSMTKTMITSIIIISICAFGSFPWQLGAHLFYSILIIGLIYNMKIKQEELNVTKS